MRFAGTRKAGKRRMITKRMKIMKKKKKKSRRRTFPQRGAGFRTLLSPQEPEATPARAPTATVGGS